MIPYIVLILAITGIIGGAAAVTVSTFGDTMTQCWNSSYVAGGSGSQNAVNPDGFAYCTNGTAAFSSDSAGENGLNLSNEYFTVTYTQAGIGNIMEQVPTVSIIAIMVIIISIIAGVFVYFRYFG